MSTTEYIFDGSVKWAQVQRPSKKYNDYRIQFFPVDDATRKAVKATGTMCKIKEDEDGFFYTFRSEIKPSITDDKGQPITAFIGNGSKVTVRITVEKFVSPQHGDVARTKLTGIVVTDLIPFEPKPQEGAATATATASQDLPA